MGTENIFVDTHCHLDDEQFVNDLEDTITRAKIAGVTRIINFGGDFKTSFNAVNLTKREGLFAGVGIHPEEIDDFLTTENAEYKIAELAKNDKKLAWIIIGKKIWNGENFRKKFLLLNLISLVNFTCRFVFMTERHMATH